MSTLKPFRKEYPETDWRWLGAKKNGVCFRDPKTSPSHSIDDIDSWSVLSEILVLSSGSQYPNLQVENSTEIDLYCLFVFCLVCLLFVWRLWSFDRNGVDGKKIRKKKKWKKRLLWRTGSIWRFPPRDSNASGLNGKLVSGQHNDCSVFGFMVFNSTSSIGIKDVKL